MLRAALGNPADRRVESTAEPVLCPAALTPPRGHGPQPPGWGVAVDTNHRPFCARFALQPTGHRLAMPLAPHPTPSPGCPGSPTGLWSLGCRGVVLPLEPMDAGLSGSSRRDGAGARQRLGERPGLPGSEGGSWRGGKSSVGSRNPSVQEGRHDKDPGEPSRTTISPLGLSEEHPLRGLCSATLDEKWP